MVGTRMKVIEDLIDEDIQIGAHGSQILHGVDLDVLDVATRKRVRQRGGKGGKATPPPPKPIKQDPAPQPQRKPEPCRLFNLGKCKSDAQGRCPADPTYRLHVCSACGQKGHVAGECNNKDTKKGGKGRGKGRGRR